MRQSETSNIECGARATAEDGTMQKANAQWPAGKATSKSGANKIECEARANTVQQGKCEMASRQGMSKTSKYTVGHGLQTVRRARHLGAAARRDLFGFCVASTLNARETILGGGRSRGDSSHAIKANKRQHVRRGAERDRAKQGKGHQTKKGATAKIRTRRCFSCDAFVGQANEWRAKISYR